MTDENIQASVDTKEMNIIVAVTAPDNVKTPLKVLLVVPREAFEDALKGRVAVFSLTDFGLPVEVHYTSSETMETARKFVDDQMLEAKRIKELQNAQNNSQGQSDIRSQNTGPGGSEVHSESEQLPITGADDQKT